MSLEKVISKIVCVFVVIMLLVPVVCENDLMILVYLIVELK